MKIPAIFQSISAIKLSNRRIILLLLALTLVVFGRSLFYGFIGDDYLQVVENAFVQSLQNLPNAFKGGTFNLGGSIGGIYYKPVLVSFFMIEFSIFSQNVFFYHLVQVALHTINAYLIFLIVGRMANKNLGLFTSILFLIHPLNVESVVYISALQEPLFLLFGLLGLYVLSGIDFAKNVFKIILLEVFTFNLNTVKLVAAHLLLLLSILSKETGALFLIIYVSYVLLFKKELLKQTIPLIGLTTLLYLFLRFIVSVVRFNTAGTVQIATLSLPDRLLSLPAINQYYINNFFFPMNLIQVQSWVVNSVTWPDFILPLIESAVFFTALLGFGVWALRTSHKLARTYFFFLIWLVVGLGLHWQIVPLDQTAADRWVYFPIIGFLLTIGIILREVFRRVRSDYLFLAAALVLTALSVRSIARVGDWSSGLILSQQDQKVTSRPDSSVEASLGLELIKLKEFDQSKEHLEKAVQIFPGNMLAWNNLGLVYHEVGQPEKSQSAFEKSIQIGSYYLAYENLTALLSQKNPQQAIDVINQAVEKYPYDPKLWYNLIYANIKLENHDGALAAAEKYHSLVQSQDSLRIYNLIKKNEPIDFK